MLPSWVIVLKLCKKVYFFRFCAELIKKSKSIKAIYIDASERSRYALSENGIVIMTNIQKMVLFIMLWLTVSEILVFQVEEFC